MRKYRVAVLDESIAFAAADISLKHGLASADAFVYATAVVHAAQLVTSDNDFRGLPGVTVI
jgi:predicted nucleic acid-binding protein